MQTALRITNGELGTPYHQRSRMYRCQPGNKQPKKKKTATRRSDNDFLMGRILPIAPDYYTEMDETERINLTTEENVEYLYCSAQRYAGLAGIEFPFRKTKDSPRINISNLYKVLDNILPENINLEVVDGRLHFCLYRFHDWPDRTLFWIPLDFTEKLSGQLKRITLEFIRLFIRHHGIQNITETSYYEMAHDYLEDYGGYNEEGTTKEVKEYAALAQSYEKGKAHRALERMKKRKFCADLAGEIQKCHPEKRNERALLNLITEGRAFITPDSPCIMHYYYDWAYEESPDFQPAGLDLQIMLTYSINDALTDEMESYFNSDCQESYAITPVTALYLTPETDRLFAMDNFPERFSKWLDRFIKHVSNNF